MLRRANPQQGKTEFHLWRKLSGATMFDIRKETGIPPSMLSMFENGGCTLSEERQIRLEKLLKAKMAERRKVIDKILAS